MIDTKFKAGKYKVPVQMAYDEDYIYLKFRYNKALVNEVRMMEGRKWLGREDPPRKMWRVDNCPHNLFQIAYLEGRNPYAAYDSEIIKHEYKRPLFEHQRLGADFLLTRKRAILAAEMGCGKSLCGIEVMERSKRDDWWYVGPRSAIKAVELELLKWDCKVNPEMMTYEKLTKLVKNWEDGRPAPNIWFDESSRIKSPTAQRSQAAYLLATGAREDHDGYVILTSGSPAPKSPLDWWNQARIACPGFLKEGSYHIFRGSMAIIKQEENVYGQAYPKIVSWLDDCRKCKVCGQLEEEHLETDLDREHEYEPSVNEVERLYKRMSGLVLVQFKKDCLDLPDKIYRKIELEPSKKIKDIAKAIVAGSRTVAQSLVLLRELSDGFQYVQTKSGEEKCPICKGKGTIPNPMLDANIPEDSLPQDLILDETVLCDGCGGKGKRDTFTRTVEQIETPKDQALRDLFDEYSDVGRLVIYGGFTGSVDRCVQIAEDCGWEFIRVDGRGWHSSVEGEPLINFQEKLNEHPRMAFIGQPGAAGMGITLTASPAIVYYSNDFNAESRIQSEDRIHRAGMDNQRGATIIDILHLESDYLVLKNLQKKRELQALTMGDVTNALGLNHE